jgi:hypothetical protein
MTVLEEMIEIKVEVGLLPFQLLKYIRLGMQTIIESGKYVTMEHQLMGH